MRPTGNPGDPVQFHPDALDELTAAAAYYADEVPRLGAEFLAEARRVTTLALAHPDVGAPMGGGRRRLLFERFPYGLVYRVLPEEVVRVLAVAHLRRRPRYWRRRR